MIQRSSDAHAVITGMPKIELHNHFNGSIPVEVYANLAAKYGEAPLPDPSNIYAYHDMRSFLSVYDHVTSLLRTPQDWSDSLFEAIKVDAKASSLRYRETFFNCTLEGLPPYDAILSGLVDGAERAHRELGVDVRFIPSIYRGQGVPAARKLLDDVLRHPHPFVLGIGMDGDELEGPASDYREIYERARKNGLKTTAHAGERFKPEEVAYAVDVLKVDRVDHGYAVVKDPELVERLRDEQIHFATAWLSSISHYSHTREGNPLAAMIDAGLNLSISSDDPGMARSTLQRDLDEAAQTFSLSPDYLLLQNLHALQAAWMCEDLRIQISEELDVTRERLKALKPC